MLKGQAHTTCKYKVLSTCYVHGFEVRSPWRNGQSVCRRTLDSQSDQQSPTERHHHQYHPQSLVTGANIE